MVNLDYLCNLKQNQSQINLGQKWQGGVFADNEDRGIPSPGCATALLAETVEGWPWHSCPLWGLEQQVPAAAAWAWAPLEKKRSCHLLYFRPVCQLVSMGTRAKREWNQMKLFSCGELLGQLCSRMVKPSCSGWGDACHGHSHSHPQNKSRQQGTVTVSIGPPLECGETCCTVRPL